MSYISPLMGASFRPAEIKDIIHTLKPGDVLGLLRDRENQYDANAIQLIFQPEDSEDAHFVGFVAKEIAAEIAPLLDEGYEGYAVVTDTVNPLKPNLEINLGEPDEDLD